MFEIIVETKVNIFIGAFLATVIALYITKVVIVANIKKISKRTRTDLDDLLSAWLDKIHSPFYIFIALFVANKISNLFVGNIERVIEAIFLIGSVYYITIFVQEIILHLTKKTIEAKQKEDKDFNASPIYIFQNIIKYALWLIAILLVLDNLGYNISALIAGLGIGGIAVAFALQNILADIFAFISIFFDKPFKIGDFIVFGQNKGTVKNIGIKTTRIITLQGEELVVPNKKLTDSEIHNFRQMRKRRVVFEFGIIYETPIEKIKKTKNIAETIIKNIKKAELDRVHFKTLGDYSLVFEVAYYVNNQDYKTYMDIQEQINLELMKKLAKEKIEFAYPTQKTFLERIK